ncbi:hypothetical protein Tco_0285754 [Tanacetum coccineum]
MDDPNMTMEEYIRFEEEKAHRHGRVFDWKTATYGKIRVDDDLYDLRSMEAEFPAIIVDDAFEPQDALQCKSQVSTPVNDEIDFRISFDESDDKDYIIICDKNSFSYKMISVNDLKTDLENDYEKLMPLIPSPEPAISCFDDLDFFEDFENEFPAIVYNDAKTSKSDLLTKPILNHQHIDEFDDETSLPEYDEEEQNVLHFNDLFPFNIIRSDDLKSEKDNDKNEIDIIQCFEDNKNMALLPHEQRHIFFRYEGLEYTDLDIANFESRLERIYTREIHKVHVVDFQGMSKLLRDSLFARMAMEHRDEVGVVVFTSQDWGRLFGTRGIGLGAYLEFLSTLRFGEVLLDLDAPDTIQFQLGIGYLLKDKNKAKTEHGIGKSMKDRRLDVGSVNIPYLLAQYLRRFAAGRKSGAHISGGQFSWLDYRFVRSLMILRPGWLCDQRGNSIPHPPPPAPARTMPKRMARLEEDVHEIRGALTEQRKVIDVMAPDFCRFSTWVTTGLGRMMDRAGVTYTPYSQNHMSY